jgi:hypothetical protein
MEYVIHLWSSGKIMAMKLRIHSKTLLKNNPRTDRDILFSRIAVCRHQVEKEQPEFAAEQYIELHRLLNSSSYRLERSKERSSANQEGAAKVELCLAEQALKIVEGFCTMD